MQKLFWHDSASFLFLETILVLDFAFSNYLNSIWFTFAALQSPFHCWEDSSELISRTDKKATGTENRAIRKSLLCPKPSYGDCFVCKSTAQKNTWWMITIDSCRWMVTLAHTDCESLLKYPRFMNLQNLMQEPSYCKFSFLKKGFQEQVTS